MHQRGDTELSHSRYYSPAVKSKNISLCGEIMKLGKLIEDPCVIIFRLGPNSEAPPSGRHLEFQYGRHIAHTFAHNFETKADRNVIPVPTSTFSESRNPAKSLV